MLKSLREALAQYALGEEGGGGEEIVAPLEERVKALLEAIEETEKHLRGLGFDPPRLKGAKGFVRIQILADGVEAVYTWTEKEQTQAEVEVFILDHVFQVLPTPPFTDDEKQTIAKLAYQHIWQQSVGASFSAASVA